MAVPDVDLQWATGLNAVKIIEPSPTQKDIGYDVGKFPIQGEFNYLFNGYYQWFQYLTANVTGAIEDVESISKDFTYLNDTTYGAISDPTANDKINKKVSASQDISIQSTAVGIIEGLDYRSGGNQLIVDIGSCYLYKAFSTKWGTPVLKFNLNSQFVGSFIKTGDWDYFGITGFVASGSSVFGSGVTLYAFALASTSTSSVAIIGDTSLNATNAVSAFASTYSVDVSTVYVRRIASLVVGSDTQSISLNHLGNYTSVSTSGVTNNTQAGRYVFTDSAGLFIPATAVLLGGATVSVNLENSVMTPILSQSVVDLTISYNGTSSNRHTVQVSQYNDTLTVNPYKTSSNYSTNLVQTNGFNALISASTFDISVSSNTFDIGNISTGASPASDILYLDIKVNGWTDYREQYKIG